jgi:hypothetical protein
MISPHSGRLPLNVRLLKNKPRDPTGKFRSKLPQLLRRNARHYAAARDHEPNKKTHAFAHLLFGFPVLVPETDVAP